MRSTFLLRKKLGARPKIFGNPPDKNFKYFRAKSPPKHTFYARPAWGRVLATDGALYYEFF